MRIKKGFTLAEVLIVLMVIGAIATMTIPSLMKGVTETQWKTAYKKAYNAVINLCAMERIAGALPSTPDAKGVTKMFESLQANLSIKDYTAADKGDDGAVATTADLMSGITYTDSNGNTVSTGSAGDRVDYSTAGTETPWINTDDGLSYKVIAGTGTTCGTKGDIDGAADGATGALGKACVGVIVDVNSVSKGPNTIESQQATALATSGDGSTMKTLTGDQYYIFVGTDGATAGAKKTTVTGRIVGDLK